MRLLQLAFLVLLAILVSIPSCGTDGASESTDPMTGTLAGRDFVLVVADSLHAAHTSAHGYPLPTTPFLETLSARGVRAERALSQTSWTLSSVVSLFTGRVQESHGVLRADQKLPADGPRTLAEMFRAAGYRTVAFVENGVVAPHSELGRGFDRYEYIRFMGPDGDQEVLRRAEAAFAAEDDRPLFLYLHLLPPHMPYRAPEPFASLFTERKGASSLLGTNGDVSRMQMEQRAPDDPDVLRLAELYDTHIAYADDRVRQLLAPRLEGDHAERTAVLVTSDHGEAFMQHGRTGHNACVYEEMVHVPWILVAPGVLPAGVRVAGPTSLLDTLPTVAQLFDLRLPGGGVDGVSLVGHFSEDPGGEPAIDRSPPPTRELYLSSRYPADGKTAQFALVEGRWKFITRRRGQLPALFDTDADPLELHDLADEQPQRAADMAQRLAQRRSMLAREHKGVLTAPLTATMVKDLEALGYAGTSFDEVVPSDGR